MASPLKARRLFELLEEQQEPFLLKDGYSKRSFNPKCAFRGWRLINTRGLTRKACVVYWKFIKKALNWERLKLGDCFLETRREAAAAIFHRLSSSSAELGGDVGWKEIDQHSPISVLELHYDETFSDHNHSMEEGLESKRDLHQPRQLHLDYLKELEENCSNPCESSGGKMNGSNNMGQEICTWEKQSGGDLPFARLLDLELSATQKEWTRFQAEKREIEKEIGGIIFEEMTEECVFDMLPGFHCTFET